MKKIIKLVCPECFTDEMPDGCLCSLRVGIQSIALEFEICECCNRHLNNWIDNQRNNFIVEEYERNKYSRSR